MPKVSYLPKFIKNLNSLPKDLQEEAIEKIELFKNVKNHKWLKVHKLKGRFSAYYSFAVNYKVRIVFTYLAKDEAILMIIGDHDVYK